MNASFTRIGVYNWIVVGLMSMSFIVVTKLIVGRYGPKSLQAFVATA